MSLYVDIKKNLGDFHLDVSFESEDGVLGLLGASGSGKSLTLMCIAGIVKPDSGKIALNGTTLFDSEFRINLSSQQRRVGYLFQNYALFPHMTVRQNILCGMRLAGFEAEHLLHGIVEIMQLSGLENRHPNQLSGGQQQRTALARILIRNPDLIVLDEPFSALDSHLRGQLQIELQKLLKRYGKDALLVTHNREEAYQLCHKTALLDSGKVIVIKDTKQLFADPESRIAADITGCKNITEAKKAGDREVFVPSWGVKFITSQPVRDNLCAIGIRAHQFKAGIVHNRYPVRITEEIEGLFEYNYQFRYDKQIEESADIWQLIPKEERTEQYPLELGVDPSGIMLLYR